ncbi:MAG: tetrahydromethanopterin synthesis protein [Hyphomicrobium sp. 32-62-53]|nr:MAG: tetrahydromethanopterin synthesis protein [Hyphomicrobium sp. 12-62-95]OYX97726.1 MAG: tetrahydromethanopterin synthesis protein [Hyphomicrobium sp. 32-62-53]
MPRIVETILTTLNAKGEAHIAPLGLIDDEGTGWIVAPFRPSRTLDNLMTNPFAVASHVDDVRVFAGCITGRRNWPLVPADTVNGVRLESAVSHWELKVDRLTDHEQRPKFHCQIVHSGSHRPWPGFNRAQSAVLELAVLSTRLGMLPPEKVEAELKYLQIAIDKTAGDREHEAWNWLMERIDGWRRGDDKATKKN